MKKAEFLELSGKEAYSRGITAVKKSLIDVKELTSLYEDWLENKGFIKTDFGWFKEEEIGKVGISYRDKKWFMELERIEVERKTEKGKIITKMIDYPVKFTNYLEKKRKKASYYSEDTIEKRSLLNMVEDVFEINKKKGGSNAD